MKFMLTHTKKILMSLHPCSYTNDVIDLSLKPLLRHVNVKVTSSRRLAKGTSKTFDNSVVDMVTSMTSLV